MIIGITGGIGSGKSFVSNLFEDLGVPCYNSDLKAKELMVSDLKLKSSIINLLGDQAYEGNSLNRQYISSKVFNDKSLLSSLNNLVHPIVKTDFYNWVNTRSSLFVLKESAILFETGSYLDCDKTILVTAPIDVRINRVIKRDNVTKTQVESRIKNQWKDEQKKPLADYIIKNTEYDKTKLRVDEIFNKIISL